MPGGTTLCPVCNGKCLCIVCAGHMEIVKAGTDEGLPCPVCCGDPNKHDRLRGVCRIAKASAPSTNLRPNDRVKWHQE
jgi:hypothetical protein